MSAQKAMVLAAGVGSRLGSITSSKPKCLVEVAGVPMLEHVLTRLKDSGVQTVVLNLHHFPDQVKEFLASRDSFGLELHYSFEPELLDTGGALKKVKEHFQNETYFYFHNADILCDVNFEALEMIHQEKESVATLLVRNVDEPRVLLFDQDSHLLGWKNTESKESHIVREVSDPLSYGYCGISLFSKEIFDYFPEENTFSIIATFLKLAETNRRVFGFYQKDIQWFDVGTPEMLAEARTVYRA